MNKLLFAALMLAGSACRRSICLSLPDVSNHRRHTAISSCRVARNNYWGEWACGTKCHIGRAHTANAARKDVFHGKSIGHGSSGGGSGSSYTLTYGATTTTVTARWGKRLITRNKPCTCGECPALGGTSRSVQGLLHVSYCEKPVFASFFDKITSVEV